MTKKIKEILQGIAVLLGIAAIIFGIIKLNDYREVKTRPAAMQQVQDYINGDQKLNDYIKQNQ